MKIFLSLLLLSGSLALKAQSNQEKLIAFKITGYLKALNDSTTIVQVFKPAEVPVVIPDKQVGLLYHFYSNGKAPDTAMIGWGRCNLVKGDYYYFGIHQQNNQSPAEGDLLYLKLNVPCLYDGLLLKTMNHAVSFTNVYGEPFMQSNAIFTNTRQDEWNILDSMVKDIRFTGTAMQQQMPEQDQLVASGMYKGKKVFTAMQAIQRSDLELFFKYMTARPRNYAGNTWKLSEIFATWMAEGAPTVVEH